jgi:hypothetical protein
MEVEINFSFIAPQQDQPIWQQILTGLCNGEAGALFQERMLVFGTVVDETLEAMLDEWPVEYFAGQYWQKNGKRFELGLQAASDADQFAEELKTLFALCGVTAIEVELLGAYE